MATDAFEEPMVAVRDYPTEPDARHVAALLVENGIGAFVEPVPADELPEDGPSAGYRVLVLSHELERAEEALGLREPSPTRVPADSDEPMKLEKKKAPWKLFALIWVFVMITVPLGAFLLTYWLMSS
jgi:hypothetical protein